MEASPSSSAAPAVQVQSVSLSLPLPNPPECKRIYVGNLTRDITDSLLKALFEQFGEISSCKIIRRWEKDPYAFIEFAQRNSAYVAITSMTGRHCMGKRLTVNWARQPGEGNQTQSGNAEGGHYFTIYVGGLSNDITEEYLQTEFGKFGTISSCKIMQNAENRKKFGFISFTEKRAAEAALVEMDGKWLTKTVIRTNWAFRKAATDEFQNNQNQPFSNTWHQHDQRGQFKKGRKRPVDSNTFAVNNNYQGGGAFNTPTATNSCTSTCDPFQCMYGFYTSPAAYWYQGQAFQYQNQPNYGTNFLTYGHGQYSQYGYPQTAAPPITVPAPGPQPALQVKPAKLPRTPVRNAK